MSGKVPQADIFHALKFAFNARVTVLGQFARMTASRSKAACPRVREDLLSIFAL